MTATETETPAPRRSRLPLIIGIVLGLAGAGGGFMATRVGLLGLPAEGSAAAPDSHGKEESGDHGSEGPVSVFVPLDPMILNVSSEQGARFLRFVAQIEAAAEHAAEVEAIKPRFVDVLNGYLRAVDLSDFKDPRALDLLRGQMLRRLQTVAGDGVIRDLLIMEFILN
jgi:flagellar FliL protein